MACGQLSLVDAGNKLAEVCKCLTISWGSQSYNAMSGCVVPDQSVDGGSGGLNGQEAIVLIQKIGGRGIIVGEGSWQSWDTIPSLAVVVVVASMSSRATHSTTGIAMNGQWSQELVRGSKTSSLWGYVSHSRAASCLVFNSRKKPPDGHSSQT